MLQNNEEKITEFRAKHREWNGEILPFLCLFKLRRVVYVGRSLEKIFLFCRNKIEKAFDLHFDRIK